MERDLSTVQCYKCREMGHYSRECPNSPALATRENASSSTRRFSVEEKGKTQVHLIEAISEGREKALMGLRRAFSSLRMRWMSWPKLNDRWRTLLILM